MVLPEHRYFMAAPTRPQAKLIFWERLKRDTKAIQKGTPSETELTVRLLNNSLVTVVGMDKPERIEGQSYPPVKGIHITEFGNMKPEVWGNHVYPILADNDGFAIVDGVPEGRNFYYDMVLDICGGAIPKTLPEKGAYAEKGNFSWHSWFSSDVLPEEFIREARNSLDAKTYRQEFEGSFEDYEGLLYWAFGTHNLRTLGYDHRLPVHIGVDFNVDPMTAVFCHIHKGVVYQFGEAYLNNSNTFELVEYIKDRFEVRNCLIYPDSTGKNLESNARESDIAILQDAGFPVYAENSNPKVRDRVSSVNSLCRSETGKVRYFVDPEKCPHTLDDFNKVESTPDGRENKKQEEQGLVHISSALGYLCNYRYPIKRRTYIQ